MAPISAFQVIECRTIDNTTIRGCFYAVAGPAPAIIMTPGFNCVKEMLLPDVAEVFQSSGFNAFIYDPRNIGDSDGSPRNQIDPLRQAEDLTDIITHISALPSVDASQITLWGMSFGATVSACTASLDRRVKALVMVCPILSFVKPEKREKAFVQIIKDRQSQLRGNEAFTLPPFNARGENPIGMAGSGGPGGLESFQFMNAVIDRGAPSFRNRITLQSYYKLALFEPKSLLCMLDVTPVMMIVPELDAMSPPEEQIEAFEKFQQPKELYTVKGKGHLTVLSGDGSEKVSQAQIQFLEAILHGGLAD
ncbi:DltD domain-containing protein [Astrocystis sublimbata]|nr:DltD domain-containing protein [Astrocystis sublimbata]KAI0198976.1 DltD domain-containing protein [Astrocystis sublimbata]